MSVDYIQTVGTDVPNSCGSCCFTGFVQSDVLHGPSEPMSLDGGDELHVAASTGKNENQLLFFNCPEGAQRFSAEAGLRLVRTRGFFFTRWTPSAVMGMPGLLFTINDAGVKHANFFGPDAGMAAVESHECDRVCAEECMNSTTADTANSGSVAGLGRMLSVLGEHYFLHRTMTFQQLRAGSEGCLRKGLSSFGFVRDIPLLQHQQADTHFCSGTEPDATQVLPCDAHCDALLSSFFVLALQLSPTSALVGFNISSGSVEESERIFGYALLHAPKGAFDPKRAKAHGVPPGPLYGQLKQGMGVWVDGPATAVTAGDEVRRFIDPRSVRKATVGSQHLYVSLVLDGDRIEDVARAVEALFGCDDVGGEEEVLQERQSSAHHDAVRICGNLRRLLCRWKPQFLYRDQCSQPKDGENVTPKERLLALVHIVHVQNIEFFSSIGHGDHSLGQKVYASAAFARAPRGIRENVLRDLTNYVCSSEEPAAVGNGGTKHHFCADIQHSFSAFPTALAHRYHLNSIAAAHFPVKHTSTGEMNDEKRGPVWPYAVKHPLLPSSAAMPIVEDGTGAALSLTMPTHATASTAGKSKVDGKKDSGEEKAEGLLRYPSVASAVAMLSEQFRAEACAFHKFVGTSPNEVSVTFRQQQHKLDGGGALSFLGTGSAIPSKYRNVSGAFVELMYDSPREASPKRAVVVLDFGEGSAGQLAMLYCGDDEQLRCFVRDLVFVFISHSHADHHLGLMSLLELRRRLLASEGEAGCSCKKLDPLLVVCPQEVRLFIEETWGQQNAYKQWLAKEVVFDVFSSQQNKDTARLPHLDELCRRLCCETVPPLPDPMESTADGGEEGRPLWEAAVFPVDHPANAHALLLRFPTTPRSSVKEASRVLLFSGDTRPCGHLVERCRQFTTRTHGGAMEESSSEGGKPHAPEGVYICLHEATFGDGCEDEAVRKCHSTLREALQVADLIGARHIVLNHFSQRYPKLPGLTRAQLGGKDVDLHCKRRGPRAPQSNTIGDNIVDERQEVERNMCFGFDFMRLTFAALENGEVSYLTPLFVQLLQEYESWGVGTTKRLRE
uniref:ribonuclease Z n=1 Tax=Trypanosoma congolense (strain IL3000) TaxID=1068625 RepID=G0ULR7_TRYCI|nr:unnamed protein product [Trypanosoma congolense IL3000]